MEQTRAVLLDIEGTTTPIAFVYDVLFPFARARVASYLARHLASSDVREEIAGLISQHEEDRRAGLGPPALDDSSEGPRLEQVVAYVHWLMDRDRKVTPLKSLQGKIWEEGYRAGELKSEMFDDVPPAIGRWRGQQKAIHIFSSGSRLAQRLLFSHTVAGDLTPLLSGYFDTTTGAKSDPQSYRRIAESCGLATSEVAFISDVVAELDAAQQSGMQTFLCVRPGNRPQANTAGHTIISTFNEITF